MNLGSRLGRVALSTAVAVGATAGLALLAHPAVGADDPLAVLERSRTATVREDFSGTLRIEWTDGSSRRSVEVPVSGTGGTVQVGEAPKGAAGQGANRWVAGVGGWQAGWDEPAGEAVPAADRHWDLTVAKGPDVAGRPTTLVTAADPKTGAVRVRIYTDRDTGILMRREVLDRSGRTVRSVGYVDVKKLGGPRATPASVPTTSASPSARSAARRTPDAVRSVPDGFSAPRNVGGRFELVGRYVRGGGAVQLFYSDGLLAVSVFEEEGDPDWEALPRGGETLEAGSERATGYEVAGGTVLIWGHAGLTYTAVGDLPMADLRAFAADLDRAVDDGRSWSDRAVDSVLDFLGVR